MVECTLPFLGLNHFCRTFLDQLSNFLLVIFTATFMRHVGPRATTATYCYLSSPDEVAVILIKDVHAEETWPSPVKMFLSSRQHGWSSRQQKRPHICY